MNRTRFFAVAAAFLAAIAALAAAPAWADGIPRPWQMGMQEPATLTMERLYDFHNLLLVIITVIATFVLALLLIVFVRFREGANPTPSKTSHNTTLEVVWTVVPVLILLAILVPSFRLMYFADRTAQPEMTIKAIGHQWYWSYEYPDNGNFTFDAMLVPDAEIVAGQYRLLETDTRIVLPVDTDIRLLTTADDVIHAWAMPAFGVKIDAVPGRLNETWMHITKEGLYFGQCSELCGTGHGYMPIAVEAVSKEAFAAWVAEAQTKFARVDGAVPATQVASEQSMTQVASEQSMTQVASEKPTAQLAANVSN
jgi:cytochrome c oxidase subunit 2